ncbi:translocation/assembly module TamB domain-containing protein [Desulfopila aestuarii]|uniref:Autotransporter translocation and assembly factor TamB n=1 Tax=Desulfopila aestuarii DSM 18488 TaxID=1121416 RepID=A0A1M7Y845_9BACT|nr:translocation/assembly module TamB domain-containing protein [Desulfopila aestuarii]SHO48803.1 Autotransporter translocation and assembly factor TamB [Desulfopila aestuarii DSM 18488]
MKRLFRLTCFLLAMILAALMVLGWTESGLRVLVFGGQLLSGGMVHCGSVNGTIFQSFELNDVTVSTPAVELKLGQFNSSWQLVELFEKRLHIDELALRDVEIRLKTVEEAAETTEDIELPAVLLPIVMLLDHVSIDTLSLLDDNFAELTRITHLSFGLSGIGSRFTLHKLVLRAPGYDGDLEGLLDTEKDWHLELAGRVEYRDFGVGPFNGDVRLKGPLARLDAVVDLQKPAEGHVEGQILELPNNFKWFAKLKLDDAQLADGHETLPEMLFSVAGTAEGEMLEYRGTLEGTIDYLFFHDVACTIEVNGNEDQIEFPKVTVANSQGKAELTDGLLSWKDDLVWHGRLVAKGLDPAMMLADYPGAIDADLYSAGQYGDKMGLTFTADFRSFSGMLRGYELAGHGQVKVDRESVEVEDLLLQSGTAMLQMNGRAESSTGLVNWQDSLSWKAGMQLKDFDPALFFPDYPGTLNTIIHSEGALVGKELSGSADIETLNGTVRGYPVKGRGKVRMVDQFLHIDDLLLQSGRSSLQVTGQAGETIDISAKLGSEDLGEFFPGASGAIHLATTLTGERSVPIIQATGTARKLHVNDIQIDNLQADLKGGLADNTVLAAKLRGSGLQFGTIIAQRVEFDINGFLDHHNFSAKVVQKEGEISFLGDGSLAEDYSWQGMIHDLHLNHDITGLWQQAGRANLSVNADRAKIAEFCLKAGSEKLCLDGDWSGDKSVWQANLEWQELNLARLNKLLTMPEPLHGKSTATLSASGDLTSIAVAQGSITIRDGGFGDDGSESELKSLDLHQASVQLNLQNDKLTTDLSADFVNGSALSGTTEVVGFGVFATSPMSLPLKGKIRADIQDLAFVAPLTEYFIRPTGMLQGDLVVNGTVGSPVVEGKIMLVDGLLEMPTLGITVRDVSFNLTGAENGIAILASMSSGPGSLKADGKLQFEEGGMTGDFHFLGEDFDTTSLPEYEVRTSPDIRFVFDANGGRLTGRVSVPHAMIAPERLTGSVSVSEDVVYLDGDEKVNGSGWPFSMSLKIDLGDDVRLEGYGITGYLRGDLQVDKVPGSQMLGKGQLSLFDGIFAIYGRTLKIERSRLMFAGGPIDNPGVDVRAKKIIADNKRPNETIEVGVDVSGTADNLEFALFSDPAMEESDILAYMVVGRAMSDVGQQDESLINSAAMALGMNKQMGALGQLTELIPVDEVYIEGDTADEMSFVVGKHLTKELFIGYGHNFFLQEGEVRLRYNLGAGFSIETRSSGERTGADLLYSFEK